MAKKKKFCEIVKDWTAETRVAKAQDCVKQLTERVQRPISLHAANKIINYSSTLSEQIPRSYAGHAFQDFQNAMFRYEVMQILALWDKAAENSFSIPTVIELIDCDEVISILSKETFDAHANRGARNLNPSNDPKIQNEIDRLIRGHQERFATSQAELAEQTLKECIGEARELVNRETTTSIRNFRDHLSHSLWATYAESSASKRGASISNAKFGEERQLLDQTVRLVQDLYCWVNGVSFDLSGDISDRAERNARELWANCRFDI